MAPENDIAATTATPAAIPAIAPWRVTSPGRTSDGVAVIAANGISRNLTVYRVNGDGSLANIAVQPIN